MQRLLMVDVDPDRRDHVRIGPVKRFANEEVKVNPVYDMSCLCEAVCVMIRICHKVGLKDQSVSIRDCIKHLQNGFADGSLKAYLEQSEKAGNKPTFCILCEPGKPCAWDDDGEINCGDIPCQAHHRNGEKGECSDVDSDRSGEN